MDSPVSPSRVLAGQPNDQSPDGWVDGRPSPRLVRWLCPASADSLFVPPHHGFGFHDQKRAASTCPSHCIPKNTEDGAVDVGEVWSVDLALQNEDLVTEGKDLFVAGITRGE